MPAISIHHLIWDVIIMHIHVFPYYFAGAIARSFFWRFSIIKLVSRDMNSTILCLLLAAVFIATLAELAYENTFCKWLIPCPVYVYATNLTHLLGPLEGGRRLCLSH